MEKFSKYGVVQWQKDGIEETEKHLVREDPLTIKIDGRPYSVILRTPGEELAHAAGFCLGEGIIDSPGDLDDLTYCDESNHNCVAVTLSPSKKKRFQGNQDLRGNIRRKRFGISSEEIIRELCERIAPLTQAASLSFGQALNRLETLSSHQPLRKKTSATHAAAIFDTDLKLMTVAEDVGRHNAVDKAVGNLFLNKRLFQATLLVLSSRISYELVQKAAKAKIPSIFAISRPTSLAVALAEKLNITLACLAKSGGIFVFTHKNRLKP